MPSESEPVHVEPVLGAQLDSFKEWLCKKALQGLKICPQAWGIHHMSYDQLISDPSMYVKKRSQRSDDSILLRHIFDVVGTGPDEHPGERSAVMELVTGIPLDGHTTPTFAQRSEKLIFMAPWRPDVQFAIRLLSTQVINPTADRSSAQ